MTNKEAQLALANLKRYISGGGAVDRGTNNAIDMAIEALSKPEIVRCKDCKYARLTDDGSCKYCDIWFPDEAEYMDGDYYCASAERKSNG